MAFNLFGSGCPSWQRSPIVFTMVYIHIPSWVSHDRIFMFATISIDLWVSANSRKHYLIGMMAFGKPLVMDWFAEAVMWTAERPGHFSMQLTGLLTRYVYCESFKCIIKKSVVMWNMPLVQWRAFSELAFFSEHPALLLNTSYKLQSKSVCPHWVLSFQLHVLHRMMREALSAPEPPSALSFHPIPQAFYLIFLGGS